MNIWWYFANVWAFRGGPVDCTHPQAFSSLGMPGRAFRKEENTGDGLLRLPIPNSELEGKPFSTMVHSQWEAFLFLGGG